MLTIRDHMALRLAGERFTYETSRVKRARDELGLSEVRFWQVVDALLDRPEALAAEPMTVGRLRRLRDVRRAARAGTYSGADG